MSFDDAELIKEFVVESQEHLADVENQLLTLESQGDAMDVALVNKVFRAVHSIKGAAGFMGLETLQSLAHREEEVLNKLRNKELRPTSLVINTLLRASDRLKTLLDEIETSNDQDVNDHIVALEKILNGEIDSPESPLNVESVADQGTADATSSNSPSNSLSKEALREFLVESYDNIEQLERDLISLEKNPGSSEIVNSLFRNIHTIKGTAGFLAYHKLEKLTHVAENLLGGVRSGHYAMDSDISGLLFESIDAVREILRSIETTCAEGESDCSALIAKLNRTNAEKNEASSKVSEPDLVAKPAAPSKPLVSQSAITPVSPPLSSLQSSVQPSAKSAALPTPVLAAHQPPVAAKPAPTVESAPSSAKSSGGETSAADSTIRVDVALLDKLMTCVGELVLARNQIIQYSNGQADNALHSTCQRLNLITTELQEGVMKTRMQPIGNVWSKFPRLVRDLAAICEKEVRIEMEGKETELDKTIIEAIKDPLTHLVRNTVDHGIERPEVRVANGKQAEGCLTLRAYHEGGQVNIEICDDGAGLNVERIKNKAVEKGLMTQEQVARMADRDVGNLIFLPGFSTAEKVSNVSGRGVGMDVVKTNIEKIGGSVDLQSQQGRGTTIKIKIPLTLAIIPALIVTNDGNRYAIPQVNLLELVRLDGEKIQKNVERIQGAPVYRLRGQLLPLIFLRKELQTGSIESMEKDVMNIVVLRADDRSFGLVVDRIVDSEEIVVKPLSKQLKGVPVYSGTTIMGDGKVALILDILGLATRANIIVPGSDRASSELVDRSNLQGAITETLLVLGVGKSNRYALPLSQVTRLEKLQSSMIELADNSEVVQYRGEILPIVRLSNVMGVCGDVDSEQGTLDVVVYTENNHSVGLVVDRIIDIVETTLETMRPTTRSGLTGSAVIQNHVTDLLDLPAVIRQTIPACFD